MTMHLIKGKMIVQRMTLLIGMMAIMLVGMMTIYSVRNFENMVPWKVSIISCLNSLNLFVMKVHFDNKDKEFVLVSIHYLLIKVPTFY
ncbi:Uncharacterized protein TCM_045858 [Theobroma cacao]|uniref:Uncharacterized protein n=1 Tax=Theobroma cacao TaxID=3641 RepID=S1SMD7_THECC|nr:Uncharacterized protein TCM_045858 [Theobroma cacao]